jgi:hypothetical protein
VGVRPLVIGGSDAGIAAALRAHELDPGGEATVLVADAFPNFSICGLPYYLSGDVADWRSLAHRSTDLEAAPAVMPTVDLELGRLLGQSAYLMAGGVDLLEPSRSISSSAA